MKYLSKNSKILPFVVLVSLSLVLLALAYWIRNPFAQNIISNMAATSIYALIALFTYDRVKSFADREKNHELRDYAQSEIDPQIVAILISVSKLIFPKDKTLGTTFGSELEKFTKQIISEKIKSREYLGFEILRNSHETTKNIRQLLENNFIRPLLDDEQVLLLLKLSNRLEKLFKTLSNVENLLKTDKPLAIEYKVFGSKEISSYNAHFPNRKLLVKKIPHKEGMGIVEDFADFVPQADEDSLLSFYKVKEEKVTIISDNISEILTLAKGWIKNR